MRRHDGGSCREEEAGVVFLILTLVSRDPSLFGSKDRKTSRQREMSFRERDMDKVIRDWGNIKK